LGPLVIAPLDADHARPGARHRARELAQPGTDVEHALAAAQAELAQRGLLEQLVEARQARLFLGVGAVHVGHAASIRGRARVRRVQPAVRRTAQPEGRFSGRARITWWPVLPYRDLTLSSAVQRKTAADEAPDLEAEHDPVVARRSSLAGLRREASRVA